MIARVLLFAILVAGLQGQILPRTIPAVQTNEQTLAAVLRWEILWNDSPRGFRVPNDGVMTLAVYAAPDSVSYCSHQAGVCVKYRVDGYRNWEASLNSKCDDSRSDEATLMEFVGKDSEKKPVANWQSQLMLGQGLSGIPRPEQSDDGPSGLRTPSAGYKWTAKINLGSRAEIVRRYQQLHPAEIEGLKKWISASNLPEAGVRSITIACFAPTDPMVYYYIDRPVKGPVFMAVFWDSDRHAWTVAASLEEPQGTEKLEEMYRIVESIVCSTVTFQ
jgi:hypothetical protein